MKREDIISMAREADAAHDEVVVTPFLERFSALVASAEREVCAQAAWDIVQYEVHADLADQVAAAIRARSTP